MAIVKADISGWWDLQEGSGTSIGDSKPSSPTNGTGSNISWTTGGPTNLPNGIAFNGSSSKVDISKSYALSSGSICLWMVTNATAGTESIAGNNLGGNFDIFQEASTVKGRTTDSNDRTVAYGGTYSTATKYFVTWNWAQGGTGELFVNASSAGTVAMSGTVATDTSFILGARNGGSSFFNGNLYQVILFNRVLTSAEVTALYNAGAGKTFSQSFPTAQLQAAFLLKMI